MCCERKVIALIFFLWVTNFASSSTPAICGVKLVTDDKRILLANATKYRDGYLLGGNQQATKEELSINCCGDYSYNSSENTCFIRCEDSHCKCQFGHRYDYGLKGCRPICTRQCGTGICAGPDLCACVNGPEEHPENIPSCIRGYCNKGKCLCYRGYYLDLNSNTCRPICPLGCGSGICSAPGHCSCAMKDSEDIFNCQYGYCDNHDNCICHEGFEKRSGECQKIINSDYCLNGYMKEGKCVCCGGYFKAEEDVNVCYPYCGGGCLEGECTSPNNCGKVQVLENLRKHDCDGQCVNSSSNVCNCGVDSTSYDDSKAGGEVSCLKNCKNGYCIDENECKCDDGYVYSPDSSSECIPFSNMSLMGTSRLSLLMLLSGSIFFVVLVVSVITFCVKRSSSRSGNSSDPKAPSKNKISIKSECPNLDLPTSTSTHFVQFNGQNSSIAHYDVPRPLESIYSVPRNYENLSYYENIEAINAQDRVYDQVYSRIDS